MKVLLQPTNKMMSYQEITKTEGLRAKIYQAVLCVDRGVVLQSLSVCCCSSAGVDACTESLFLNMSDLTWSQYVGHSKFVSQSCCDCSKTQAFIADFGLPNYL